ncbi:113aa long hypothetical protein [Pyrococcus horikoshii OT3]|uniref:Uncharacterized protein n=1 Tax=Pyrococcus horikoshii (strain ATCC 700860 / DSM 12428 / JCM 9974 / NBRC 100139 / OT-3) TaxID=70601 RepID=O58699_PYRHO|nr:113aa long hypothetical protein [Pyrococcus horikoshii OT3]
MPSLFTSSTAGKSPYPSSFIREMYVMFSTILGSMSYFSSISVSLFKSSRATWSNGAWAGTLITTPVALSGSTNSAGKIITSSPLTGFLTYFPISFSPLNSSITSISLSWKESL